MIHTLEETQALLRKRLSENPDRINPYEMEDDGPSCRYNGPDDTHCVAGTIIIDDWGVASEQVGEGSTAHSVLDSLERRGIIKTSNAAKLLLSDAQRIADGFGPEQFDTGDPFPSSWNMIDGQRQPREWGEVLAIMEAEGLL